MDMIQFQYLSTSFTEYSLRLWGFARKEMKKRWETLIKKEHLRIFMKSFDSCWLIAVIAVTVSFFASELTLTWLLRDKIVYIVFLSDFGFETRHRRSWRGILRRACKFLSTYRYAMYPKTNEAAILWGKTGWWEVVEIGSRRGIGCGGGKGGRFPCSPTMLTINSCSVQLTYTIVTQD